MQTCLDLRYDLLRLGENQFYIVAHDLVDSLLDKIPKFADNITNYGQIDTKILNQCQYKNPFQALTGGLSNFLPSNHVHSKQGTGFVHIGKSICVLCIFFVYARFWFFW